MPGKAKDTSWTGDISPDTAQKLWMTSLWLPAVLGGAAGFLPPVLEGSLRKRKEPDPDEYDVDVDIPSPEQMSKMKQQVLEQLRKKHEERMGADKEAAEDESNDVVGPMTYLPIAGLLSTLGGGLSYWGGSRLADQTLASETSEELEKARKRFKRALLKEQLAAARSGEGELLSVAGPGKKYPKAASLEKNAFYGPLDWLYDTGKQVGGGYLGAVLGLGVPSGVAAYYLTQDYLKGQHPDWKRYRKARRALGRRISGNVPYAELEKDLSEEDKQHIREMVKEQLQGQEKESHEKEALWPFDVRDQDGGDEEDEEQVTPSDRFGMTPEELTEESLLEDYDGEQQPALRRTDRDSDMIQQAKQRLFG